MKSPQVLNVLRARCGKAIKVVVSLGQKCRTSRAKSPTVAINKSSQLEKELLEPLFYAAHHPDVLDVYRTKRYSLSATMLVGSDIFRVLPSASFNASEVTLVPERSVALSDLRHVKFLGEGCSAAVSLVVDTRTGAEYALKVVKKARLSPLGLKDIQAEQCAMAKVTSETWALGLEASWANNDAHYLLTTPCFFDQVLERGGPLEHE
ncbi:hypothetical protein C8R44DRAFT_167951 [Mycena epipterygia]|nr:hypothetical protein C8R44DRAFT_167951 [Mycena epipterygia]